MQPLTVSQIQDMGAVAIRIYNTLMCSVPIINWTQLIGYGCYDRIRTCEDRLRLAVTINVGLTLS